MADNLVIVAPVTFYWEKLHKWIESRRDPELFGPAKVVINFKGFLYGIPVFTSTKVEQAIMIERPELEQYYD